MKRETALLVGKKGLEDIYHTIDVRLVGINHLNGLPKGVHWLDACKILIGVLLNAVKHSNDNGRVIL